MTERNVKNLIQDRIIALLNAKNTTMRHLSRELGFSDGYINQILNNGMMPSIQAIIAICNASKMSLCEFFNTSETYPLEYYKLNEEIKKMSVERLVALYILLKGIENEENEGPQHDGRNCFTKNEE